MPPAHDPVWTLIRQPVARPVWLGFATLFLSLPAVYNGLPLLFFDSFDYLGNGIDHSTLTGIAAVVGAGRLMNLTVEQMVHAIGITVGGNTATRQGRA